MKIIGVWAVRILLIFIGSIISSALCDYFEWEEYTRGWINGALGITIMQLIKPS